MHQKLASTGIFKAFFAVASILIDSVSWATSSICKSCKPLPLPFVIIKNPSGSYTACLHGKVALGRYLVSFNYAAGGAALWQWCFFPLLLFQPWPLLNTTRLGLSPLFPDAFTTAHTLLCTETPGHLQKELETCRQSQHHLICQFCADYQQVIHKSQLENWVQKVDSEQLHNTEVGNLFRQQRIMKEPIVPP